MIIQDGCKDLKTIGMIYEFLANLIDNSKIIAQKVLKETRLMESFHQLLETCKRWHSDLLNVI